MSTITEGRLCIDIPDRCMATKFDGSAHGLSHCMKAVDFIIETPRALLFLELKDPDAGSFNQRQEWIQRLEADQIDNDLKIKFRDTWLYMYGTARLNKPVTYLVLLGLNSLSSEALSIRTAKLKKQIPLEGPAGPWTQPFLTGCAVHNLDTWNRSFGEFRARRL